MHLPGATHRPYTLAPPDACAALQTTPTGLSSEEAARRLAIGGPNELPSHRGPSPWSLFFAQFRNVLIVILLFATATSAVLGHAVEAIAITVIVLLAVTLGFVQEYRAERAIEALRRLSSPTATVLRSGRETEVAAREVVPGDVMILRAGNQVAADGRLLRTANLKVLEAALTGESVPVEKSTDALPDVELGVGDRRNMVHAGTVATYGRGRAVVVATGPHTEFGRIARMLETVHPGRTPLQENLDRLGAVLARAALVVVAVVVAIALARGQPVLEMLLFGIALAVAVVPEALPAVVTISLALGVQRLVHRGALMRRLAAVETLGSTSVICSDKTGTLTRDEMTVRRICVDDCLVDVSGSGYAPQGAFLVDGERVDVSSGSAHPLASLLRQLLQGAALASDAAIVWGEAERLWRVEGDPTEGALVVAAAKAGLDKAELDERLPRLSEVPFSAESKRMTTVHGGDDGPVAYSKGAPEVIVAACSTRLTTAGVVLLDAASRERVLAAARDMAGHALRVLAVATRPGSDDADGDMTLLGLAGMIDPPREEARAALDTCARAGIRVVMITGDHPTTAEAVARELGLLDRGRVVTGAELDGMDDAALERDAGQVSVFARVSPAHKLRVVTALQHAGHVVAMTGDGVNDAPALKQADIGVAMGQTGTDVAREAAAMTITDDNFASIVAAVEEGRGIFGNIRKYLTFLLSSNVGEIGLMAATALLGLPLPLTAVQILYVNLATDGLPALALAVDPPEPGLMSRGPRVPRSGIFSAPVLTLVLVGGLWSMLANLALFAWARGSGRPLPEAMTMTFASLVLIQFIKAYNFRSDRVSVLHRPFANRWLNLAIAWEVGMLLLVIHLPVLHAPFGTWGLSLADWTLVAAVSLTILPVLELTKLLARRGWFGAFS